MRTAYFSIGLGVAACAAVATGKPAPSSVFFDTRYSPYYGDARPALKTFLAEEPPLASRTQRFCIVGYRGESDLAWVHWREGRRLILWEGRVAPEFKREAISQSRRDLDLRKDVVATEAEVAGSTYLVTRAWVAKTIADCRRHGVRYSIARPKRGK